MEVRIPSSSFCVRKGDLFAINSNTLHFASSLEGCLLHSLVFSPSLVTGTDNSVFAKKYVHPLLSCPSFSGFLFPSSKYPEIIRDFCAAFEVMKKNRLDLNLLCGKSYLASAFSSPKNSKKRWSFLLPLQVKMICVSKKCWNISIKIIPAKLLYRKSPGLLISESGNVCAVFKKQSRPPLFNIC